MGPVWLETKEILRRASRVKSERRRRYREAVKDCLRRGVEEDRLEQFRDVVAIGSAKFIEEVKAYVGEGSRETEHRGRLRQRVRFEDVVIAVEECRGEKRESWLRKHGDTGKWTVLWLARRYCGRTLSELGQELGGMDYAAVSMGLRRFEDRLSTDRTLRKEVKVSTQLLNI